MCHGLPSEIITNKNIFSFIRTRQRIIHKITGQLFTNSSPFYSVQKYFAIRLGFVLNQICVRRRLRRRRRRVALKSKLQGNRLNILDLLTKPNRLQ